MTARRLRAPGVPAAAVLATVFLAGLGRPLPAALALMTETETVPATFTTEVLDPPTNLDVTGPVLIKTLTWTATVDARATGYLVLGSTTSGGPYTLVATVTPRTTTTYEDVVTGLGPRYYVLQSYYGSWTSVNSNQDSA
jgi:hypothetical protein